MTRLREGQRVVINAGMTVTGLLGSMILAKIAAALNWPFAGWPLALLVVFVLMMLWGLGALFGPMIRDIWEGE